MDWRLPLAVLAVLSLLVGAVALTAQVETDLEQQVGSQGLLDDAEFRAPDPSETRLDLKDLELPRDLDVTIPEGTKVSPDGMDLKLDKPVTLDLPPGFPLEDLPFSLPEDFRLELPPGTQVDADGLTLPRGAALALPDGSRVTIPPGARLDLPPEIMQQLFRQGLREGTMDAPASLSVENPTGAEGVLDLPPLPEGGAVTLPPGTTIRLPDGSSFPFPPGELARAVDWRLPAGTTFDWPAILQGGRGFSEFPAVTGPGPGGHGGPCDGCRAVFTEITSAYPERIRKSEPFPVEGVVVDRETGEGLAGVRVDVYLNESKYEPGYAAGSGVTDAHGRYRVDARMPSTLPAGDYNLVGRSRAFVDDRGVAFDEAWSDPPIAFIASTTLTLDAPAVDGVGARVPLRGTLTDESGAPVAGADVVVFADGARAARAVTGEDGAWDAGVTFHEVGEHVVGARFHGTDALEPSEASARVRIVDFAFDVPGKVEAQRGGTLTLSGRTLSSGSAYEGVPVTIAHPWGETLAVSDARGYFSARVHVPEDAKAGATTITYSTTASPVTKAQALHVVVTGSFTVKAPEHAVVGANVPVHVTFTPSGGGSAAGVPFLLVVTGPAGIVEQSGLTAEEAVTVHVPAPFEGTYDVRVSAHGPHHMAPTATTAFRAEAVTVRWDLPAYAVRGESVTIAGRVDVPGDGSERFGFRVRFTDDAEGMLDADGRFRVDVDVPKDVPAGEHPLALVVHVDGQEVHRGTTLPVKIRTEIRFDAPTRYEPGEPVLVNATLVDDGGATLDAQGVTVTASVRDGDAVQAIGDVASTTHRDGDPSVRVTRFTAPTAGEVAVRATWPGEGDYLPATAETTLRPPGYLDVAGANVRTVATWGGLAFLGVALAAAAVVLWRRRDRVDDAPPFEEGAAVPVLPAEVPVRFPDLEGGLPPVFGAGERVRVVADEPVRWRFGDRDLGDSREALLEPDGPGEHALVATARDGRRTVVRVRVVEYRREIAREFDALLDVARNAGTALTSRATAREVEDALLPLVPADARRALDDAVVVVEVTNYADVPVTRDHYVRFHRAATRLTDALGGAGASHRRPRPEEGPGAPA